MQARPFQRLTMRCLHPIMMYDTGRLTPNGKRKLSTKANPHLPFEQCSIPVPCGKCSACRLNRQREWVTRLRLESLSHDLSCFVTLTYEKNPFSLIKSDIQQFVKRLRNCGRDYDLPLSSLRYMITGEYGSRNHRPHWHGILFGVDCLSPEWHPSLALFKDGYPVYTSPFLEKIWSHGFVTCDHVTPASIKYVSKYILKDGSVSLKSQGLGRSSFVNVYRVGRSVFYSLRPLFLQSVENGFVVVPDKGRFSPVGVPKGFDRYLERCNHSLFDSVRSRRSAYVRNLPFDIYSPGECEQVSSFNYSLSNKKGILDNES